MKEKPKNLNVFIFVSVGVIQLVVLSFLKNKLYQNGIDVDPVLFPALDAFVIYGMYIMFVVRVIMRMGYGERSLRVAYQIVFGGALFSSMIHTMSMASHLPPETTSVTSNMTNAGILLSSMIVGHALYRLWVFQKESEKLYRVTNKMITLPHEAVDDWMLTDFDVGYGSDAIGLKKGELV